jgi:hypothetical protein
MKLRMLIVVVALGSVAAAVFADPPTAQPPVQTAPGTAQGDWYYCAGSETYYPLVLQCLGGWHSVSAGPDAHQYVVPK